MRKYFNIPLLFFFLAAGMGLFLRWQFIEPTPGIRFTWVLHGHSHVMFLGWVMNVLFLAFVSRYFKAQAQPALLKFFWILQVLVVAMMISFPMQGYGMYSIIFTTLHTLAMMVFIVIFFRHTANQNKVSLWYARAAWFFFFISTAGPFSLGYLMATGLGDSVWSQFSIYYYLHFQYNGFFIFGVFSLFFQLLEAKQVPFDEKRMRRAGALMALACIPAYALSTLFAQPGLLLNVVGALAAALQLWALVLFLRELKMMGKAWQYKFRRTVRYVMVCALIALVAKSVLQLLSAHPVLAQMAYALRPVVIAYLHLVLVGVVTLFILAWYMEMMLVRQSLAALAVVVLFTGFLTSELCLVAIPWWPVGMEGPSAVMLIFIVSILMVVGAFLFYLAFLLNRSNLKA